MTGRQLRVWRTSFEAPTGAVLTQVEAAEWYGCHERTWRAMENGRYREGRVPKFLADITAVTRVITVKSGTFKRVR